MSINHNLFEEKGEAAHKEGETLTILLYLHRSKVAYYGRGKGPGWGGGGGRGRKSEGPDRGYRPKKTGDIVDRRQNNGSVKAVSPSPLRSDLCRAQVLFQLPCLGRVTRTMSVAPLLRNNPKRKKSNFRSPAPPPYS